MRPGLPRRSLGGGGPFAFQMLAHIALLALQLVGGTTLNTPPTYSPETQAKLNALKQVPASIDKGDSGALKLIEAGLADSNDLVRMMAATGLFHAVNRAGPENRGPIDLRAVLGMRDRLVACIDDRSGSVRASVIGALSVLLSWQDDPGVVNALTRRFQIESELPARSTIVIALGKSRTISEEAERVIVAALSDRDSAVKHSAVIAVLRTTPDAGLAPIVTELRRDDGRLRTNLVYALSMYGARAVPYIGLLRDLAATETQPVRLREIEAAIKRIESGNTAR